MLTENVVMEATLNAIPPLRSKEVLAALAATSKPKASPVRRTAKCTCDICKGATDHDEIKLAHTAKLIAAGLSA